MLSVCSRTPAWLLSLSLLSSDDLCCSAFAPSFFVWVFLFFLVFCYVSAVSWPRPLTLSPQSGRTCSASLVRPTWPTSASHHSLNLPFQAIPLHELLLERKSAFITFWFYHWDIYPAAPYKLLFVKVDFTRHKFFYSLPPQPHISSSFCFLSTESSLSFEFLSWVVAVLWHYLLHIFKGGTQINCDLLLKSSN